jgi:FemAB-related protein (PEP-CTERM system-associated)
MMQIRLATSADRTAWDDYVLAHPEGTVFHLTKWQEVVTESFGHQSFYLLALADEGTNGDQQKVVGVLPLFQIKSRLFGNYLVSVPFAELGGPLANDRKVADALLKEALAIAERIDCDYLELKNKEPLQELLTKDLYFNFSREIFPEVEDNLLAIPRKSRAAVRKGIMEGLTAEVGNHLIDEFYEVMARSYHNLGTPIFPRNFFRNIMRIFGEQAQIMVVRNPVGQRVAAVQSFFFRDRVMPYYAGSLVQYRSLCPNDFMYWKLMEQGCQRGFKVFDFGRSKAETGSFKFKKNWGFEPEPLAYQYHLVRARELPNLSPANPKYRKKIEMWRKMPFALTKIIGPPLAKYLA